MIFDNQYVTPEGFTVSHPLDRSGSLFVILKGICISVDDNGVTELCSPGTVTGLSGLWFGRTLKTVISKTYVDGFFIPGEKLMEGLEQMSLARRTWIEVYLRTLPALQFCERLVDSQMQLSQKEDLVRYHIIKSQEQFCNVRGYPQRHRIESLAVVQYEITNMDKRLYLFCFFMGTVFFVSAILTTFEVVFCNFNQNLWYCIFFCDSLILTEACYQMTFVAKRSGGNAVLREIFHPYAFLSIIPVDMLLVEWKYGKYARWIRLLRFCEPLRRVEEFKKRCPQHLRPIIVFETLLRVLTHIHFFSLLYHQITCGAKLSYDQKNVRCSKTFFYNSFYDEKMFGKIKNESEYQTMGNTMSCQSSFYVPLCAFLYCR